ncbi:hypothetical protein CYMTET_29069 [Cymbomonas tetramitiformis]|uniref:Hydroxyproline O-arabinosyltransferase-like domain-containing protein n=1 Tax=Cymbomonas tetramitiformis TaxID=36881 RepID=A0AAE0KVI1_9CHLO|nr:hypothetical protein CYMTET_38572 [Cymbomonas tetramitiformis]KAK3262039.1 hypothetical protein CYMTET_29069 [Cymbomonas tetramitiformis]
MRRGAKYPGKGKKGRSMSEKEVDDPEPLDFLRESESLQTEVQEETPQCSPERKPFHVVLTTMSTTYLNWQSEIMYYHFKKQQRLNPCTEMANFTRLVANDGAQPDGLANKMPSIFYHQIDTQTLDREYGSYAVLNRPHSVLQFVRDTFAFNNIKEDYIFFVETDHVFLRDIPNLATPDTPVGYPFGYMRPSPSYDAYVKKLWPNGSWNMTQQIGPSPLIIYKDLLVKVAEPWSDFAKQLKADPGTSRVFGWVLEMWGYAIAAASVGIRHKLIAEFQCEPGTASRLDAGYLQKYYIHHYTYGSEYTMNGANMMNTIGEWSLDKRHYGGSYPPRNLKGPPRAAAERNYAALWLTNAWNEAMDGIEDWPTYPTLGTYGWRRESGTDAEIAASPIAQQVIDVHWSWSGIKGLIFKAHGELQTPWGKGKWGLVKARSFSCDVDEPEKFCLFADFSNSLHNVYFNSTSEFTSRRIGDGETVKGLRVGV